MMRCRCRKGLALMETVVLCVMIAAAVVVAVIVFGHTVWRGTDIMKGATAGYGLESGKAAQEYSGQTKSDTDSAAKFPKQFSDVQ